MFIHGQIVTYAAHLLPQENFTVPSAVRVSPEHTVDRKIDHTFSHMAVKLTCRLWSKQGVFPAEALFWVKDQDLNVGSTPIFEARLTYSPSSCPVTFLALDISHLY